MHIVPFWLPFFKYPEPANVFQASQKGRLSFFLPCEISESKWQKSSWTLGIVLAWDFTVLYHWFVHRWKGLQYNAQLNSRLNSKLQKVTSPSVPQHEQFHMRKLYSSLVCIFPLPRINLVWHSGTSVKLLVPLNKSLLALYSNRAFPNRSTMEIYIIEQNYA